MASRKLELVTGVSVPIDAARESTESVTRRDLKRWVLSGELVRRVQRYSSSEYVVGHVGAAPTPAAAAVLLRLLTRGDCRFVDSDGRALEVGWGRAVHFAVCAIRDRLATRRMLRDVAVRVANARADLAKRSGRWELNLERRPVYLRTDLWYGVTSGGSVGHIAGVLNNLHAFGGEPVFLTTSEIPTVDAAIEKHIVSPGERFWDFPELPLLAYTDTFIVSARAIDIEPPSFVYQRYSLNNFAGVLLAAERRVPFVLEYNGSEVWINRNWGQPLKHEALSIEIEDLNLAAADLVVVVSAPMREELVSRGVPARKILVNPNGVDPDVYSPVIDGRVVRQRYDLGDELVIGFIGTFGAWHGAEVLADAFGELVSRRPDLRENTRLLLVGDGVKMPDVLAAIERRGIADRCVLTGLVPQADGPGHLAACDILVSPHVPNADGTPFFGSPTKLFEYMAMGRAIVASDLDQIGEVLRDRETAVMTKPGDTNDLVRGLLEVVDDVRMRDAIGKAARAEAVARYTWRDHTRRIVEALQRVCE